MAKFVYAALAEVELEIGCGGDQDGLQISERDGLRTWRYSEPQGHFAWECVEGDAGRVSSCRVRVAFRDPQTGKDRAVNERVLVLGTYRRLHARYKFEPEIGRLFVGDGAHTRPNAGRELLLLKLSRVLLWDPRVSDVAEIQT
jgi:hypothetical protein